jgi:hypothetical protein
MASSISPDSDSVSSLLSYFNNTDRIKYLWAFPRYYVFDTTINTTAAPYGDLSSSASADEKSVGQTWSDPAVGQIKDTTGPSTIIVGSGFLPRSVENGSTRGGATAGQKLYLLSATDGHVYASSSVGSDEVATSAFQIWISPLSPASTAATMLLPSGLNPASDTVPALVA